MLNKIFKRLMDIIISIVGIILLIPITFVIFIAKVISKDKGPLIYKHIRMGKNGKPFSMYKFRTMVINADEILEEILNQNESLKEEFERTFKLENDPRITKIGKILRKTSLDEFPQFLNVLKGDMAVVGPRPIVKKEWNDYYGDRASRVFSVKPGVTGMWQAYARSNTDDYEHRIKLDIEYVEKNNIFFDIKIIFITIINVIQKKGAV